MRGFATSLGFMQTLEQEKFEAVKELAEITTALSTGRADLSKLKEETGNYILLREKMTKEKIDSLLQESTELLEKISQNQNELVLFKNELKAYVLELKGFIKAVMSLSQDVITFSTEEDKRLEKKRGEIKALLKESKVLEVEIKEDRKQLERERKETIEGTRLLKDRRETLERGFEELRKLKEKTL